MAIMEQGWELIIKLIGLDLIAQLIGINNRDRALIHKH